MTFMEVIIMKMTRGIANGGNCRVGDATITVRCGTDIWECEYGGRTFWNLQDLAEAIIQDNKVFPTSLLSPPKKARTLRDALNEETSPGAFFRGRGPSAASFPASDPECRGSWVSGFPTLVLQWPPSGR
jgi:hypothetical protein